jgi:hypothetical protein
MGTRVPGDFTGEADCLRSNARSRIAIMPGAMFTGCRRCIAGAKRMPRRVPA